MTPNDPDAQAVVDFVRTVGADLAAQGFPRMPAFVLTALTVSKTGSLTAAELASQLAVSPASVSVAIRSLTNLGFVRTITEPGSRRHVYALGDTPWYTSSLGSSDRYKQLARIIRDAAAHITTRPAAQTRIDELAEFFEFLDRRMPALLIEWNDLRTNAN